MYHELDDTFYSASSGSFIGQLYQLLGYENIADVADPRRLDRLPPAQRRADHQGQPDLIVITDAYGYGPAEIAARPGWNTLAAVTDGRIVQVDDDVASRWGPRVVDFLRAVAAAAPVKAESAAPAVTAAGDPRAQRRTAGDGIALAFRLRPVALAATAAVTLAVLGLSLAVGPFAIPLGQIGPAIADRLALPGIHTTLTPQQQVILFQWRLPRAVLGGLVGAALSLSGATYQGVFRNPLADPYLLGVAAGAGLGATIVIGGHLQAGWGPLDTVAAAAFVGALAGVVLAAALGRGAGLLAGHPAPGRGGRGLVPHRGADLPGAAGQRGLPGGLHLDPGPARDLRLERRGPARPLRGGLRGRDPGHCGASSTCCAWATPRRPAWASTPAGSAWCWWWPPPCWRRPRWRSAA